MSITYGAKTTALALACAAALLISRSADAQDGTVQNFALGRFTFESGASIDNAHVTYVTWGTLNAAKDNAILLPSWYGGRALSYQFLVGPDRALDPANGQRAQLAEPESQRRRAARPYVAGSRRKQDERRRR